jgi:hypothetical protein
MSDPTDRPAPVALTVSHEIIDYYEKQLGIDSSDGTIGSRIEELVALANRVVEIFGPMQEKGMNGHTFELLLKRAKHCLRGLAAPADSGGQADQPAEPSERELPTHWGHWVRNGEHYWVYGKGQMFHIQRLNVETGLPHEDTADFAITLNSAEMRGHWRPAVPDTDAYADAAKLVEEILGTLRAERDRFQEGWIASNELVEHLRAEQKAWQAAMDQVRKLRVKQRPERTDWDRDDPDIHGH